jgi:outer membrane immunogenic protein
MRNKIIFSLAGAAFGFAASGFAFAADMAVKGPPAPMPAPVYNWTGWYVGVNAGASMGKVKTDFNGAPIFWTQFAGPVQITPGFDFSDTSAPDGFIGGGQIGYNWQYSPLIVVGLEADFQGALEKDSINNLSSQFNFLNSVGASTGACGVPSTHSTSPCTSNTGYATQIDWFGTVRARLGYVWGNGEVLTYVTGGLAYGEVKINGTNTVSGQFAVTDPGCFGGAPFGCSSPFSVNQTFGASHVNTGWVLGYGTEGHLPLMPGNWTWKVESLYMDLGHLDATSVISGRTANSPTNALFLSGGQVTTNSHFTDWILRGGLNYRF